MNRILACMLPLVIFGCSEKNQEVRITTKSDQKAVEQTRPRSEPVFYNGKIYQLDFRSAGEGSYAMSVSGMSPKQEKDATAVATSSLRYFACRDGQNGHLTNKPGYSDGRWKMNAVCK